MKLIIGAESFSHPITGIGRYIIELVSSLRQIDSINSLKILGLAGWMEENILSYRNDATSDKYTFSDGAIAYLRKRASRLDSLTNIFPHYFDILASKITSNYSDHIYHAPSYMAPKFKGHIVTNIHDLSHHFYPEYHPASRVKMLREVIPKSLDRSKHILTSSQSVKNEILDIYDFDESRISVIPHGVSTSYFHRPINQCEDALKFVGVSPKRFVLSVCTLEPRKNLKTLINSFSLLPPSILKEYTLLIVGAKGWNYTDIIDSSSKLEAFGGKILFVDYLKEEYMPYIYSAAAAFVYPSFYEGFGLPLLEAMACGTPVICSSIPPHKEVCGSTAVYFDPFSAADLASSLESILCHVLLSNEQMNLLGMERARAFTWESTARMTCNLYASL